MKKKAIFTAVVTLCLATAGSAFAQGRGDDRRDDRHDNGRGDEMRRGGPGWDQRGGPPGRNDRERYEVSRDPHRGAGPRHEFRRGGRLPSEYRSRQYVINDWRGHRLSAPPRGYHWVQTGGDYVLAAIATGIIAQIILNN